ncbi:glycosyltransferase family 2 protein [Granulicella mallensis]|uniref:Glycosyl transferase family 2 n=1 Tax=Granulicella mallensis (strain ATCC BAA-1857 / DSM 23137 / MP5ACTX8) TaxID=682795 RepID=G8NXD9_GRAMM|nr:glycosyltransferase family 2 protein [Granulicella mallensis]AEU37846.1 glycosyl transferase family 2 [Granulicella mallensis MP5ACTX8]
MARIVFLTSLGLLLYTYFGYPLLLALLSLSFRRQATRPSTDFTLSVVICARNEAHGIGNKLEDTLLLNYPSDQLQIIVVSDGSTDETCKIVEGFADRGVELIVLAHQRGKTHAQNVAVRQVRGDIVVFSDATTKYSADALQYLAGVFMDSDVGAVSGRYLYVNPKTHSTTTTGAKAYAGFDNTIRSLQSRVNSITGCCGCIYAVRRALYTDLRDDIISDLVQPLYVLRKGFRVKYEPRAIASENATSSPRQEFSMRARVVARALMGLLSVYELLLPWPHPWYAFQLWSHKLLRFATPLLCSGIFLSSLLLWRSHHIQVFLALEASLLVLALIAALIPRSNRPRILALPLYFMTVNAGMVAGIVQLLRGNRHVIWQPEREKANANS